MELDEYQKIIVKDVASANYKRDLRMLKACFAFIGIVFAAIYFFGFHEDILKILKLILNTYRESMMSGEYEYKTLVYSFNKMIAFIIFLSLFSIFLLFAFFAYDIISRNKVIRYYQNQNPDKSQQK